MLGKRIVELVNLWPFNNGCYVGQRFVWLSYFILFKVESHLDHQRSNSRKPLMAEPH